MTTAVPELLDPPARGPARPPRPCRVLHVVASMHRGGMERVLLEQLRHWSTAAPFDAHALVVLGSADTRWLDTQGATPTWVLGGHGRSWGTVWRLRRIVHHFAPDVVHARTTGAWLDAAIATRRCPGVRLLLSFHGREHLGKPRPIRRTLLGWSLRQADAVVTLSHEAAEWIRHTWRIPASRFTVIPNGVDIDRFRPPHDDHKRRRQRHELLSARDRLLAVCVANLWPIKGFDVLLAAWRRVCMIVPDARLAIAGDGPQRDALIAAARSLRIEANVTLLGSRGDIPELLRAADLFVLPSRYECCSNALLEAMATGLPCIATTAGGNSELIHSNHTGWLVPPDDAVALAGAIIPALLDPHARERVGRAAREQVARAHRVETVAARYRACYARLATAPPPRNMLFEEEAACAG